MRPGSGSPNRRRFPRHRALTPVLLAVLMAAGLGCGTAYAGTPRTAPQPDPDGARAGSSLTGRASPALQRSAAAVAGIDVSGHQGEVDWGAAWDGGARFAYVKATEGTGFRNDRFGAQYDGSSDADMIRGAYHFALPDRGPGSAQADFFVDNGGDWRPDGGTLPGALDLEYNPYGEPCYGMDPVAMSHWIADFSNTYHARTGRFPVIYTSTSWWNRCTASNPDFAANSPLWIARYGPDPGPLPAGWEIHTFWQNSDAGPLPGGQDLFNGTVKTLKRFIR